MMELIFASSNKHKTAEIASLLAKFPILLRSLHDIGWTTEIEETATTLEGNAALKARAIWEATGKACFADDTGLEVKALGGRPGVYSARYAGEPSDAARNRTKLLEELQGMNDRSARFRTSICLILEGKAYFFDGVVEGRIREEERGEGGFGYDALFVPENKTQSFAEMEPSAKNAISHRGRALAKMIAFLGDYLSR